MSDEFDDFFNIYFVLITSSIKDIQNGTCAEYKSHVTLTASHADGKTENLIRLSKILFFRYLDYKFLRPSIVFLAFMYRRQNVGSFHTR